MSTTSTPRDRALRNRLAARLRELRTWPPLARKPGASLRRPREDEVQITLTAPISLAQLVRLGSQAADYAYEESLIFADPEMATTAVGAAMPVTLSELFVKVVQVPLHSEGDTEALVVYREVRATDDQYAAHVAKLWQGYQRDSQVCDDTNAQFQEFLRLKQIYEPETQPAALA